ncbi:MAG TPA: hypothetical protein VNC84_07500 [Gammaproteobacteria bacterium]|jgi:hypothetical protein|nr:hypothetical protein [Gammaproteobacteria bacterium]
MFKQLITITVLSIGIIIAANYAQEAVLLLVRSHDWVSELLMSVFSGGEAGSIARGLIALLSVPIFIGLVPSLIYWALKRSWFPYFMEIVWVVWLVQVGALIVLNKTI